MGWIFLEALVALLLAIGIVWWTMGPKRKKGSREGPGRGTGRSDDRGSGGSAR